MIVPEQGFFFAGLAIDPMGQFLYAADHLGKVYVIDIDPRSLSFHEVLPELEITLDTRDEDESVRWINDLAIDSKGALLYLTLPETTLFGGRVNSFLSGGRDPGHIFVLNVDRSLARDPGSKFGEVIKRFEALVFDPMNPEFVGFDPDFIATVPDPKDFDAPDFVVFGAFASENEGFGTIKITKDSPVKNEFDGVVTLTDMRINFQRTENFNFNLDIQNISGIAVTKDTKWAFVSDWHRPFNVGPFPGTLEGLSFETGAKIGII